MSKSDLIGIIGGTGLNQWPDLEVIERRVCETSYGAPSAPLLFGRIGNTDVVFLVRHGQGHKIPPHRINYRANLRALADVGANQVLSTAAVGGIAKWFVPGEIAIPGDLIDYSFGREHTFSDGSPDAALNHLDFTAPYSADLRVRLMAAAKRAGVALAGEGVMGITQGPRLETPAEVRRLARDGCDMVGMTGMPEAALAGELGLPYACIAISVNWAAGIGTAGIHDEIAQSIEAGVRKAKALLHATLVSASPKP
ncbi:MAG: S-methyl-5'-thioinosine phosphorylase [Panacagrimonas sp.]